MQRDLQKIALAVASLSQHADDRRRKNASKELTRTIGQVWREVDDLFENSENYPATRNPSELTDDERARHQTLHTEIEALMQLYVACLHFDDVESIRYNNQEIERELMDTIPNTEPVDSQRYLDWQYRIIEEQDRSTAEQKRLGPGHEQKWEEWNRHLVVLDQIKTAARE